MAIRLDLANLRMLAGDYRRTRDDFAKLALLLEQPAGDQSVAEHCREQDDPVRTNASTCGLA
ncbi:hypothetical protein ABZ783_06125 [Micromonospora sp. NPDC047738]|uniref:hypothetical protein n=1 Tax=Micromonospora sp. NPDC047738 TaxID=3155741 RepID=UPI0033ECDC8F